MRSISHQRIISPSALLRLASVLFLVFHPVPCGATKSGEAKRCCAARQCNPASGKDCCKTQIVGSSNDLATISKPLAPMPAPLEVGADPPLEQVLHGASGPFVYRDGRLRTDIPPPVELYTLHHILLI